MTKKAKSKASERAESVGTFLRNNQANPNWRGGSRCRTCSHPNSAEINSDLRAFAKARKRGHEMPWTRFFRDRLGKVYGLKCVNTAVMRHVRECMRIA